MTVVNRYLVIIAIILAGVDFTNRLIITASERSNTFDIQTIPKFGLDSMNDNLKSSISLAINNLNGETALTGSTNPKPVEVTSDSGVKQSVYTENKILHLKAVILSDSTWYALISITDRKSHRTDLIKVVQNQLVEGFKVDIASRTKINLTKSAQYIELIMFKST